MTIRQRLSPSQAQGTVRQPPAPRPVGAEEPTFTRPAPREGVLRVESPQLLRHRTVKQRELPPLSATSNGTLVGSQLIPESTEELREYQVRGLPGPTGEREQPRVTIREGESLSRALSSLRGLIDATDLALIDEQNVRVVRASQAGGGGIATGVETDGVIAGSKSIRVSASPATMAALGTQETQWHSGLLLGDARLLTFRGDRVPDDLREEPPEETNGEA